MYVLGLTGLMASGKTTVAKMLKSLGAYVINADDIVHDLQKAGTEQTKIIAERMGGAILNEDGSLNRQKMAEIAAAEPDFMRFIESVFHPAVRKKTGELLESAKKSGQHFVILEVPLMFETGADKQCNSVMLCLCSEQTRRKRAFERPGMTEEKWQLINSRRLPIEELISKSNHLIDTDKSLEETRENLVSIINFIK